MRERGLKCLGALQYTGAKTVAPVRERGLKYKLTSLLPTLYSRSREGAWIEIDLSLLNSALDSGRSREGAWIEIMLLIVLT